MPACLVLAGTLAMGGKRRDLTHQLKPGTVAQSITKGHQGPETLGHEQHTVVGSFFCNHFRLGL